MQLFCKPGIIHSRHYPHVSAVVFSLLAFTVLGVGFPMLLLAQELQAPMGGSPSGAPTMSPPPGGQPGFGGPQEGGQGMQQGFNQPGNMQGQQIDKGIQIDQGIRGVDKGIRIDQGIRGPNVNKEIRNSAVSKVLVSKVLVSKVLVSKVRAVDSRDLAVLMVNKVVRRILAAIKDKV